MKWARLCAGALSFAVVSTLLTGPVPAEAGVGRRDLPKVRQIVNVFPAAHDVNRRVERHVQLTVLHGHDDDYCDENYVNVRSSAQGWYGDGGNYIDIDAVTVRVYQRRDRRHAKQTMDQIRRGARSCYDATLQADDQPVDVDSIQTPKKLGRDRFGFRADGGYFGRVVFVFVRKGRHVLEVEMDGDIPEDPDRSWRFKKRTAVAVMQVLVRTAT